MFDLKYEEHFYILYIYIYIYIYIQVAAEKLPHFAESLHRHLWSGGFVVLVSGSVCLAISVAIMAWTGIHRAFVVESFIRNNESVIATQRAFRIYFELNRGDAVPDRKTILLWVPNFRSTGSATKSSTAS